MNYGTLPERYYYYNQQYSAEEIYYAHRKKIISEQRKADKIKKLKEDLQKRIEEAMFQSLAAEEETVVNAAALDLKNQLNAAFNDNTINPNALRSTSFIMDLGVALSKALGQLPFKLIDDFLNDILKED